MSTPSSPLPRRIFVALLPTDVADLSLPPNSESAPGVSPEPSTALVIDTLRFTTTACRALAVGGRAVHVASSVDQAQALAASLEPSPLLCGERHCHLIEGFDLGNSPFEYTSQNVRDRDLVFTTTNGTRAIEAVRSVPSILLAALVNRQAVCRHLQANTAGDLIIVCAGTDGQLTWEDVLTAGGIIDQLLGSSNFANDELAGEDFAIGHDPALLAHAAWQACVGGINDSTQLVSKLLAELSRALGGRNLLAAGYHRDLEFAAQLDTIDVVPHNSQQHPHVFSQGSV